MNEEKNMVNCTECLHYKSCQMWATNCLNGYIRFPFREVLCDYFKLTTDVVPRDEVAKIFEEIERNIFKLETLYQTLHCIPSGFIEELKEKHTKGGEQK